MTNRATHNGTASLADIALNTAGKVGSMFSAALHRIYAAHMERAQMRFAPQPIYSNRAGKRRPPFSL